MPYTVQFDAEEQNSVLEFIYTNWQGITSKRKAVPIKVVFSSNEWHPEPQWILVAYDIDKQAERGFALKCCDFSNAYKDSE